MCSLKCCLRVACLVLLIASGCLIFFGSTILTLAARHRDISKITNFWFPGSLVLGFGVALLVACFIGLAISCNPNSCLLVLFYLLMIAVMLCQLGTLLVSVVYWPKISRQINDTLFGFLNLFGTDNYVTGYINNLQSTLNCCGVNHWSDWNSTRFYETHHNLPESCCIRNGTETSECNPYAYGCANSLIELFLKYLAYIIGTCSTFFSLELISLHSSCIILCRSQSVHFYNTEHYTRI